MLLLLLCIVTRVQYAYSALFYPILGWMGTEIYFFGGKKDYAEAFHFWAFVSLSLHSVQGFGGNSRFSYLTF
jgi:hypothetical protein